MKEKYRQYYENLPVEYYETTGLFYGGFTILGLTVDVMFDVTNIGNCNGEEVAQLYIHDEYCSVLRPYKELAGFKRIQLDKGETKTVILTLGNEQLRVLNKNFEWVVEDGKFEVMVGNNSANMLLTDEFNILPL